jgi:hypothetical protein
MYPTASLPLSRLPSFIMGGLTLFYAGFFPLMELHLNGTPVGRHHAIVLLLQIGSIALLLLLPGLAAKRSSFARWSCLGIAAATLLLGVWIACEMIFVQQPPSLRGEEGFGLLIGLALAVLGAVGLIAGLHTVRSVSSR